MAKTQPKAAAEGKTKVRLLVDCEHGKAGQLAELDAVALKGALADGSADDHPDAVAYAEANTPKAPEAEAVHEA